MTIKDIFIKRLSMILLTSQLIGGMMVIPIFLNTEITINYFLLIFLMNSSFSIVSWILNIIFSVFFIQPLKSLLWKWLASTLCLILLMSSLHPITQNLINLGIQNIWLFRVIAITFMNTSIFSINTMVDTLESKRQLEGENN